MEDPYNLQRFVDAQNPEFDRVCSELGGGHKTSHWMWFIFPQILGLGSSGMAMTFAISSLAEAKAYLAHPILGPRLRHSTTLVLSIQGRSAREIFEFPDDLKFRSSMTLFAQATSDNQVFLGALKAYFQGELDLRTLELLAAH